MVRPREERASILANPSLRLKRLKGCSWGHKALLFIKRYYWLALIALSLIAVITLALLKNPHPQSSNSITFVADGKPPISAAAPVAIQYIDTPYYSNTDSPVSLSMTTSGGHYLHHTSISGVFGGALLGTVEYDGNVVYRDPHTSAAANPQPEDFAVDPSPTLSKNGQHYGYVLSSGIYIDGKQVTKTFDIFSMPKLLAISNDGQKYAYKTNEGIFKGSSLIYKIGYLDTPTILFDDTLDNYVLANGQGEYIYNGKNIHTDFNESRFSGVGISSNGQHYSAFGVNAAAQQVITASRRNPQYKPCATNKVGDPNCMPYRPDSESKAYIVTGHYTLTGNSQLIVDGKVVYTSPKSTVYQNFKDEYSDTRHTTKFSSELFDTRAPDNIQVLNNAVTYAGVTDKGDYYYLVEPPQAYFSIDGQYNYALPASLAQKERTYSTGVTPTKDHYVITERNSPSEVEDVVVDGGQAQLSGKIYSVELSNNKLYVYRISQR